jgi:HMG-box domain
MKEVSNRWSSMTKDEKEPYVTQAKEDKRRYESELVEIKNKPGFKAIVIEEESKRKLN